MLEDALTTFRQSNMVVLLVANLWIKNRSDTVRYGSVSKPCTLVNIKIAGKWMFIPLKIDKKCINRYWSIPISRLTICSALYQLGPQEDLNSSKFHSISIKAVLACCFTISSGLGMFRWCTAAWLVRRLRGWVVLKEIDSTGHCDDRKLPWQICRFRGWLVYWTKFSLTNFLRLGFSDWHVKLPEVSTMLVKKFFWIDFKCRVGFKLISTTQLNLTHFLLVNWYSAIESACVSSSTHCMFVLSNNNRP